MLQLFLLFPMLKMLFYIYIYIFNVFYLLYSTLVYSLFLWDVDISILLIFIWPYSSLQNGTQVGVTTWNQSVLCRHLYRDLSSPQHPRFRCCTGRPDIFQLRWSARRREVDFVFTSLMLGAHTQSKTMMDSVYLDDDYLIRRQYYLYNLFTYPYANWETRNHLKRHFAHICIPPLQYFQVSFAAFQAHSLPTTPTRHSKQQQLPSITFCKSCN